MGSVRKLSGRWYARYTDADGRRIEKGLPAESRAEAKIQVAMLEKQALEVKLGLSDGIQTITFGELYSRWEPVAKRKAGWRPVESRFRLHILPEFGSMALRTIRPADIERFLAAKASELAPRTCEHLRIHIQALYNFAIDRERVFRGDNPATRAERPRLEYKLPRYLSFGHVQRVIDSAPEHWRNFIALAAYTGLRLGEWRALEVRNVNVNSRQLLVVRSGESTTTKTGRARIVPVSIEAMPYLLDALRIAGSRQFLFVDSGGVRLGKHFKPSDIVRDALVEAGLADLYPEFTFHDLRKTCETHIYELSGDIKAAANMMGHSEDVASLHYVGKSASRLGAIADRLDFKRLSPPVPTTALDSPVTTLGAIGSVAVVSEGDCAGEQYDEQ